MFRQKDKSLSIYIILWLRNLKLNQYDISLRKEIKLVGQIISLEIDINIVMKLICDKSFILIYWKKIQNIIYFVDQLFIQNKINLDCYILYRNNKF